MDTERVKQNDEVRDLEVISLRKRVFDLESQLDEAKKLIQKHLLEANEVDMLKMKSTDTLTKAKSVIFENTKMIKNQELQIEALNQQVESLRDVVKITKELLEIRNLETDQLEAKIHCMEEKHKAEKERHDLMHKRLEQMIRHNGDLKREYETQLCLFKALRERYNERELAEGVVKDLKSDIKIEKDKKVDQNDPVIQNGTASTDNTNPPPIQQQAEIPKVQEDLANQQKNQEEIAVDTKNVKDNAVQEGVVEQDKSTNELKNDSTDVIIPNTTQEIVNKTTQEELKNSKPEDNQPNLDTTVKQ
ncbi:protein hook homolog [Harmonia axyridis]|uniref:protein hook homolog n=1 Tax=Harmonia axyridis TaxID=115357 RepID=UPI001E277975|nr:protein hook homolog [Harmonia axyridis]